MLTTRNDLIRRRYDAITGSPRFRVEYNASIANPYTAYIDNRAILSAPTLGAAIDRAAQFYIRRASRRRAAGCASRLAHGGKRSSLAPGVVKHIDRYDRFMTRHNALKRRDAMTSPYTQQAAREFFYRYLHADSIGMP